MGASTLVKRAIDTALAGEAKKRPAYRRAPWAVVKRVFGTGSSASREVCRQYGVSPGVWLDEESRA